MTVCPNASACSTWAPSDYLVKPFALSEFEARVRALLRRASSRGVPELQLGRLRLDLPGHRAWIDETALELTAREFGLLEALALRPDRVTSRAQLIEALCDWDQELTDNGLDIAIHRLRRKLHGSGTGVSYHPRAGIPAGRSRSSRRRPRMSAPRVVRLRPSLRRRLLIFLLIPMAALLLLDALLTYGVALSYANRVHDHDLSDDALTLATMLSNDALGGELTPQAKFLLEYDPDSRGYFNVRSEKRGVLAGSGTAAGTGADPGIQCQTRALQHPPGQSRTARSHHPASVAERSQRHADHHRGRDLPRTAISRRAKFCCWQPSCRRC